MGLDLVSAGRSVPEDFNVVIEIPMNADPIKYEVDKESGALFVDRFIGTAMHYPCNYGYIPKTLSDDGDPLDVLVITPFALQPGVVVRCRPLGMLRMEDEAGPDEKIVCVPHERVHPQYAHVESIEELPSITRAAIEHFFERYKDLEPGKWVKIAGWVGREEAEAAIAKAIAAAQ